MNTSTASRLFDSSAINAQPKAPRLGVFDDNKQRPIHRWYPFVEGYSADLVHRELTGLRAGAVILDPFGGSGTTALAAAEAGFSSVFCEVNPYLAWVADVKINRSREGAVTGAADDLRSLEKTLSLGRVSSATDEHPLLVADRKRGFFPTGVAAQAVGVLERIGSSCDGPAADLARLALATALIPASNMVRRTDLRKRRGNDPEPEALLPRVARNLREIAEDVTLWAPSLGGHARRVGSDARQLPVLGSSVDLVVTSPPYLNGTNYCRNTKLELLALGLVDKESELGDLRLESIAAGINNISGRRETPAAMDAVERVALELDDVAYDKRIPAMVRMYFADMREVFAAVRRNVDVGTRWLLDIGDSRFCGVHVPTDELLCVVAQLEGWSLASRETIRPRRSYDGSPLTQVLLEFEAA